jgi:superfamily II DNA or RNA helicase
MPKAIISNRIYLDVIPEVRKYLVAQLTYKIPLKHTGRSKVQQFEIIRNYVTISDKVMSIPQGRIDLIPEGYEIVDKRVLHELPFPNPIFPPRDYQQPIIDDFKDTGMLNALVGWGKTFTALHIARNLGQKTLIVTHNTFLRDQWIQEIENLYEMPVGVIGSGKYDIDHTIVVGNVQSIIKYIKDISKEFGTIILDEMHHVTADTFSDIIDASHARYRVGLSGTMVRTDGKHVIFKDYFGFELHQPPQSGTMTPTVLTLATGIQLTPGVPWVNKINNLLYDEDYQKFIANIGYLYIQKGYVPLIVADRTEFLEKVGELIGDSCVCITGTNATFDERKALVAEVESGEKNCIAGSIQIFKEGISINRISCIINATPGSNQITLEQLIGRAQRQCEGKLDPIVIDLQFSGVDGRRHNKARLEFYQRKGWEVKSI